MSLVPVESGEATPFDPIDFLQFIPFGAGVAKPLSSIFPVLTRGLEGAAARTLPKELAPIQKSIGNKILDLFKKPVVRTAVSGGATVGTVAATTIPKQVATVVTNQGGKTVLTTVDKALIGGGLATITTGLITLTPTGQQIAKSGGQVATDFSGFIKQNGQLLSIFLIIAGGALLVGALKK